MEHTQLLEFGGLRSSVVVDGLDVPQYGVQYDEDAREATSWIVSEADKPFAIHAKLMNRIPGENYIVQVCLDGHKAAGVVIRPQDYSLWHATSTRVSDTETRKFMFGSLELSDDDALFDASSAKALGEIRILFHSVGVVEPSSGKNYIPPPQAQKVHERAQKGMAHSVKYGGTEVDPLRPTTSHFSCSDKILIASHIIRYRPLAMLQANGIVPYGSAYDRQYASRSPSPVPGPSSARNMKKRKASKDEDVKPDIGLKYEDDEEGIIRKERELKEQLAQLQKKRARLQQRPAKKVKQEEEDRKPVFHGEIIDLTI